MNKQTIAGVYIIQCVANGKKYIGSSTNIYGRWGVHRYDLRHKHNSNRLLQEDWDIYGESMFTFNIIERVSNIWLLEEREDYYIDKLCANTISYGYNITTAGGQVPEGSDNNQRVNITPVIAISIVTGSTKEYATVSQACWENKIPKNKANDLLNYWKDKKGKRSSRGFLLVRKEEYDESVDYLGYKKVRSRKPRKEKVLKGRNENSNGDSQKKAILLTNVETGEQVEKKGIKELCREEGFCRGKVFKCLNGQPKQYQHHGYYFEYGHI